MRHTHTHTHKGGERIMIKKKKCCHNYCEFIYPADKYRRDKKMDLMYIGDEDFQYDQSSIHDNSNSFSKEIII